MKIAIEYLEGENWEYVFVHQLGRTVMAVF